MNKLNKIIAASLLASVATAGANVAIAADLSANYAVASNYIWRGTTQSSDETAMSGGVDYSHKSGAYAGIWQSSLDGTDYEMDIYGGYKFKAGTLGLDVGYIKYLYPVDVLEEFDEVYLNAEYKTFGGGIAITTSKENGGDTNDIYLYGKASFKVKAGLDLGVVFGSYNFDAGAIEDYNHFQVSLSKKDFTIALDKNDKDASAANAPRLSVSWSQSFDL